MLLDFRWFRCGAMVVTGAIIMAVSIYGFAQAVKEWKSGKIWPEPEVVAAGDNGSPPSDAIVLFDGKDMSAWVGAENWPVEDGVVTVKTTGKANADNPHTKRAFGDCQLHLEFAEPDVVKGSGQGRGNSGVFLMGKYEVQILDSYHNKTYFDGQCGAIYKQTPPLVNVCRKPGEWQTYDMIFQAPAFNSERKLVKPAYVTVLQNGVLIQNHTEIEGSTSYYKPPEYEPVGEKEPLVLQDHGNPVRFRNIWIRELKPMTYTMPEDAEKDSAPAAGSKS
jgi:3-keto-disaccharide hydrolase